MVIKMRIKNLTILGLFFIALFGTVSSASSQTLGKDICQPENGPLVANGPAFGMPCYTSTLEYVATILRIGLCRQEPQRPTTSRRFIPSSCQTIYENSSLSPTYITLNQTTPLSGVTPPNPGPYTFIYVEYAPEQKIKVMKEFDSSRVGSLGGSGKYCWSENSEFWNWYSIQADNVRCGNTPGNPGYATLKDNSLWFDRGVYIDDISFPGTATIYLLKADKTLPPEGSGAPNASNGVATGLMLIRQEVNITPSTSEMNLAFNVRQAAILDMPVENTVKNFGVGASFPIITFR